MIQSAITRLEATIVAEAGRHVGRRLSSRELGTVMVHMAGAQAKSPPWSRMLPLLLRVAIKSNPYAPDIDGLLANHTTVLRTWAASPLKRVVDIIATCQALQVPVPVIVSCDKYLDKARAAEAALRPLYLGIDPIIVRGNVTATEETDSDGVLTLPVDDSYEALPAKMFELFTLFDALGAGCGILKIDDDLEATAGKLCSLPEIRSLFAAGDYIGLPLDSVYHDRCWHNGKCAAEMPVAYGKPFVAPWARGALYSLSGRAIAAISRHFMRFPGCIAGEIYEDKAVGDALNQLGIALTPRPLETALGLCTAAPERVMIAAE